MVFLKWYLIACVVMTLISLLRVWGAINDFRKRHPNVIFKRVGFVTTVFLLHRSITQFNYFYWFPLNY